MTVLPIRRGATTDHLDRLSSLWNSSADNPAVRARQARSEQNTQFQIDHDPDYARELARLRSWVQSYEIPTMEDT